MWLAHVHAISILQESIILYCPLFHARVANVIAMPMGYVVLGLVSVAGTLHWIFRRETGRLAEEYLRQEGVGRSEEVPEHTTGIKIS